MTGCNREGGKGRNEGSPPRPSVPPKLASLASFPEPPPQRTAVLPSKTRFTTKTGPLLPFQKPPPSPPPQRTAVLPSKALCTPKLASFASFPEPPPPHKGQLFCPPRPSVHQNWRPLLPFQNPPPHKGQLFCPPRPSIRPKLASFASLPEPPPPPKGQLFCPPRASVPPKLASFASSFPKAA